MSWTDDKLWCEFLAFCGDRQPDEQLLLVYLGSVSRERFGRYRMAAAASAHENLRAHMIWRQTRQLRQRTHAVPRRAQDSIGATIADASD